MLKYTRRQCLTFAVFCVNNILVAACISLLPPYFPPEAEQKGVSATQYGFVFGIFPLTMFFMCPFFGKYIDRIGPNFLFTSGVVIVAISYILLGVLGFVESATNFLVLSLVLQVVCGFGKAAFDTTYTGIIAKEFKESVGFMFASLETCFGLGLLIGPIVGGWLCGLGGYYLPFVTVGGLLLVICVPLNLMALPHQAADIKDKSVDDGDQATILALLGQPAIMAQVGTVVATSLAIGFLMATQEEHLRSLNLSPVTLGLVFIVSGGTYALSAPCWGWLTDSVLSPTTVTIIGATIQVIAFLLLGPAPFIPLEKSLGLCIGALFLHGIGYGAELVSTYSGIVKAAVLHGYPDDFSTYGIVSGLWTSAFALGCFIGPTLGGAAMDWVGFRYASMVVLVLHIGVIIIGCIQWISQHKPRIQRGLADSIMDNHTDIYYPDYAGSSYGSIGYTPLNNCAEDEL